MAKYSEEFKIKIVTEYLNGNLGYKTIARKYNIPNLKPLKNWLKP
ncbi:transposase [Niallia circulans]|nr:transposase [Niallia circulans]